MANRANTVTTALPRKPFTIDTVKMLLSKGVLYGTLIAASIVMIFPVFWMFLSSVRKQEYSGGANMKWFPPPWETKYFTTDHYRELISRTGAKSSGGADNFIECSANTFIYTTIGTFLSLLICSMAGYALAKKKIPGSNIILMSILATMMIPGIMVLLPDFCIVNFGLRAYDTFAGLLAPTLASSFGVFLMRQFMLSIPDELIEAAKVDGAGEARTFFTIVLPLATPMLVAYGILLVLGYWNDLLWPLVVTKDLKVLQLALLNLTEIGSQRMGPVMAGAVISSTPIIILFLLVRKQFVQAMTSGALKG
jgi:multiple sugar transport system permease protein